MVVAGFALLAMSNHKANPMASSTATITPDTTGVSGAVAAAETPIDSIDPQNLAGYDQFAGDTTALARAARPDYHRWLRHVQSAAGCTQPVRLAGRLRTQTVDTRTGQIMGETIRPTDDLPDGVVYKACGNRRAAVCASCAEIYRADAYQLVAAGMKGGKGIPGSVAGHPAVFATTTAPGFARCTPNAPTRRASPPPAGHARPPTCAPTGSTCAAWPATPTATTASGSHCARPATTTTTTPSGTCTPPNYGGAPKSPPAGCWTGRPSARPRRPDRQP